jgi:hypothetical protein
MSGFPKSPRKPLTTMSRWDPSDVNSTERQVDDDEDDVGPGDDDDTCSPNVGRTDALTGP